MFQNIFQVHLPVTYNMQVCIYLPHYIIIVRNNLLQRGIKKFQKNSNIYYSGYNYNVPSLTVTIHFKVGIIVNTLSFITHV